MILLRSEDEMVISCDTPFQTSTDYDEYCDASVFHLHDN